MLFVMLFSFDFGSSTDCKKGENTNEKETTIAWNNGAEFSYFCTWSNTS